jgi:hypothetical protein
MTMSADQNQNDEDWVKDYLSPKDMRQWAQREAGDIEKAAELRLRELEFVTTYERGQLTAEEADDLYLRYHHRWPEALPGTTVTDSRTDDRILAAIDETQGPYVSLRKLQHGRGKPSGKGPQR